MREKPQQVREDQETVKTTLVSFPSVSSSLDEPTCHNTEDMRQRIERLREDLRDIEKFYNIIISPDRNARLREYYVRQLTELHTMAFSILDQQNKVDYLLLQNFINRNLRQLDLDEEKDNKSRILLPFGPLIISLSKKTGNGTNRCTEGGPICS